MLTNQSAKQNHAERERDHEIHGIMGGYLWVLGSQSPVFPTL